MVASEEALQVLRARQPGQDHVGAGLAALGR